MPLRINNNIQSLNAQRQIKHPVGQVGKAIGDSFFGLADLRLI